MLGSKPRALCTLGKVFHWAHESFSLLPSTGSRCCLRILLYTPPHSSAKQGSELVLRVKSFFMSVPLVGFHTAVNQLPHFSLWFSYFLPALLSWLQRLEAKWKKCFQSVQGLEPKRLQRSSGQKSRKRAGLKWEGSEDKGRQAQTTAKPSTIIITQEYT